MKKIILAAAISSIAVVSFADTTTTLKIRSLQQEYTQTAQKRRELSQHLLRLEGAIAILQKIENEQQTSQTLTKKEDSDHAKR